MVFEKQMTLCHDLETCCDTVFIGLESVEVDDLIVAQRGVGPPRLGVE